MSYKIYKAIKHEQVDGHFASYIENTLSTSWTKIKPVGYRLFAFFNNNTTNIKNHIELLSNLLNMEIDKHDVYVVNVYNNYSIYLVSVRFRDKYVEKFKGSKMEYVDLDSSMKIYKNAYYTDGSSIHSDCKITSRFNKYTLTDKKSGVMFDRFKKYIYVLEDL